MKDQLPADLNSWEDWPESLDINAFAERVGELSLDTFREVLGEVIELGDDAVVIATSRARIETDPLQKLRWLQEPLVNVDYWPEPVGSAWDVEFLHMMWECISIVKALPHDPERNSALLRELLADPDIWICPVAPTALLAIQPLSSAAVDHVLVTFLSAYAQDADGSWSFIGTTAIDSDELGMWRAVPLVAMACLHPEASPELVSKTADVCMAPLEDPELALFFWTYVSACLVDVEDFGLWIPQPWWDQGFFGNGLAPGTALVGSEQLRILARAFVDAQHTWPLANYYGEDMTEQLAAALAQREELSDEILRDFAAVPYTAVKEAVLAHAHSSDETKALAAL